MVQQVQPEAPYPPPPAMAVHPGMQQLHSDFEHLNLQHVVPQYSSQGNSYTPSPEGHYHPQGQVAQPDIPYLDHGKVPITYDGWTLTKQVPTRANQKATWSKVVRTPMPESQNHLRDLVLRQKNKGKSAIELYNSTDMQGFKKEHVKRLIADKTQMESDLRFEYKLGYLKLVQQRTKPNQRQTNSMVVVLKRVFRNGAEQPLGSGQARAQVLEGEIVDLAAIDNIAYNQSSHPVGFAGQYIAHPHPEYVHAQPHDEHPVYIDHRPAIHLVHTQEAMPPMPRQSEQYMAAHDAYQQQQHEIHHQQQQQHFQEPHTPEKKEKGNKKKDQKPEVHQKKEMQNPIYYDSTSDSLSDNSSLFTNETPNTEYSGHSSHQYYKDKKHDIKRRSSRRDSRSRDHDVSPVRQVFRERRRKSPARSAHSGQDYEFVETIIATSDHDRPHDRMYLKDRSGHLQRTSSYNDSRSSRPVYRHKRLNSYAHPVMNEHPDEEKERLQYEIAAIQRQRSEERREKARLESDRLERQKLELERERLEGQRERDRLERVRLEHEHAKIDRERSDRHDRGRFDAYHERPYAERPYADRPYRERERPRRFSPDYDARREDLYYR